MSKKDNSNTFHPKLISIAQSLKAAETALFQNDCVNAVYFMYQTMNQLRPEHKKLEYTNFGGKTDLLIDVLRREHLALRNMTYPGVAKRAASGMYSVYLRWFSIVEEWVWVCGYWDNKSYGGTSGLGELANDEDWEPQ